MKKCIFPFELIDIIIFLFKLIDRTAKELIDSNPLFLSSNFTEFEAWRRFINSVESSRGSAVMTPSAVTNPCFPL